MTNTESATPRPPAQEEPRPPETGRARGPAFWARALLALLLLACIVGGGVLLVHSWNVAAPSSNNSSAQVTWSRPWCAPPAALSTNFAGVGLSGLAENDVWSVGAQITHWNGSAWTVAFSPAGAQDVLRSILELAPNNVWVVGERLTNGLASHTLALHWDGTRWQSVNSPDAQAGGKNTLVALSGRAPDDLWAVGFSVPRQGSLSPLIEHWDGARWSIAPHLASLGSAQLTAVKALARDDVWAVGYRYILSAHSAQSSTQPLAVHWNGKAWQEVATPNLSGMGGGKFYNLDGSSASDLWAVGSVNKQMLTEHWNGKGWSMISSPSVFPDSNNWLAGVAVGTPDNAWAVGRVRSGATTFQPFIEHWNGQQWQVIRDPDAQAGELDSISLVGQQFWIVGIPRNSGGHAFVETLCP